MCARSAYEPGFNYCMGLYKRWVVSKQKVDRYFTNVPTGELNIWWRGELAGTKMVGDE